MNHLPDDPRQWPDDPFALLGVERGVGELDLKRAYTRLIRRFKPEHHPKEFQRIRDAYEQCQLQFRWFSPAIDSPEPERDSPLPEVVAPEAAENFQESAASRQEDLPRLASVDEAERLWRLAIEGNLEEAYGELRRLAAATPDRVDLPLRLYWLLACTPGLDAERTRHDWLAEALARSRLTGAAVELYRRELAADPPAALSGPYLKLLAVDADPESLLQLGRLRVAAAGRSGCWTPIDRDLVQMARTVPLFNESSWLYYLGSCADWTVWSQPWPLAAHLRDELKRLRHLELAHAGLFDQMEATERVALVPRTAQEESWTSRAEAILSPAWVKLVPTIWADGELNYADAKPALDEAVENPGGLLRQFDRFQRDFGGVVLGRMAHAFQRMWRLRSDADDEYPADSIRGLVYQFHGWLPGSWHREYPNYRMKILGYLRQFHLSPMELTEACSTHPDPNIRRISDYHRENLSLQIVWLACELA